MGLSVLRISRKTYDTGMARVDVWNSQYLESDSLRSIPHVLWLLIVIQSSDSLISNTIQFFEWGRQGCPKARLYALTHHVDEAEREAILKIVKSFGLALYNVWTT